MRKYLDKTKQCKFCPNYLGPNNKSGVCQWCNMKKHKRCRCGKIISSTSNACRNHRIRRPVTHCRNCGRRYTIAANGKKFCLTCKRVRAHKRRASEVGYFSTLEWRALCAEYGFKCLRCGRKRKLTVDHIVPLIKGGRNVISNIQPLCDPCNKAKGVSTIDYR